MTPPRTLGALIRRARLARGWSTRDLEAASGVANPNISRIENGLQDPSFALLQRLARGLGVPVSRLIAPLDRHGRAPAAE